MTELLQDLDYGFVNFLLPEARFGTNGMRLGSNPAFSIGTRWKPCTKSGLPGAVGADPDTPHVVGEGQAGTRAGIPPENLGGVKMSWASFTEARLK